MSKDVRTRLSGVLEEEFLKFRDSRKLSNSEALQALISRGLEGVILGEVLPTVTNNFSVSVQTLMIVQRLLVSIDQEELKLAKEDAVKYFKKEGAK